MGHFDQDPFGASNALPRGAGDVRPDGWRKPTAGLAQAEQLAALGETLSIGKTRAVVATKRVAASVGLKAADLLLLDTLAAFTQPQDWEQGRRPIVWASNAYLMAQTGFSLSALKRHARRLAELGVVSFQDSPNGKRWGHRDADGVIVEAYGFDLSPMAARVDEFEHLHAALQAERQLCLRLKRQITVTRRMIRARLDAALSGALSGPWAQMTGLFEALLGQLPRRVVPSEQLHGLLEWFKDLQAQVEAAYIEAVAPQDVGEEVVEIEQQNIKETQEMNPREVNDGLHIQTTKQPLSVTCNSSEKEDVTGVDAKPDTYTQVEGQLNLPVVMQACPEFASWARNMGGYLKDWGDLHRVAGQLRPMIGISDQAWAAAQDRMGLQAATAALVLVFEKHTSGEVASPGGYLRGMVEKAGAGELHLERSFFGRLSGMAA